MCGSFFVISNITYFEAILGRSIIGVTTPGAAPSGLPVMGRGPGRCSGSDGVLADGNIKDTHFLSHLDILHGNFTKIM